MELQLQTQASVKMGWNYVRQRFGIRECRVTKFDLSITAHCRRRWLFLMSTASHWGPLSLSLSVSVKWFNAMKTTLDLQSRRKRVKKSDRDREMGEGRGGEGILKPWQLANMKASNLWVWLSPFRDPLSKPRSFIHLSFSSSTATLSSPFYLIIEKKKSLSSCTAWV